MKVLCHDDNLRGPRDATVELMQSSYRALETCYCDEEVHQQEGNPAGVEEARCVLHQRLLTAALPPESGPDSITAVADFRSSAEAGIGSGCLFRLQ